MGPANHDDRNEYPPSPGAALSAQAKRQMFLPLW